MSKLTAEVARRDIGHLKSFQADPKVGLSLKEEKYLQALEIALPILEQQGGWIKCSEQMPDAGTSVLLYDDIVLLGVTASSQANLYGDGIFWCSTTEEGECLKRYSEYWHPLPLPPQPRPFTNPQMDNDGWIEWGGGECPVDIGTLVEFEMRDGDKDTALSTVLDWPHENRSDDIIAYRVVPEQPTNQNGEQ